ncbi:MAG: sigma-70 family RNA polymerase sigma factor [Planctomycetota bacterium]
MPTFDSESAILDQLRSGGPNAAAELFEAERERLQRFVMHRMDPRLQGRLDLEDVMQESQLVVVRRHADFIRNPAVPFYVWMRSLTGQVLIDLHRKHLQLQVRNVNREVSLENRLPFQSSAHAMRDLLIASGTSPSHVAIRDEQAEILRNTLEHMNEIDREVLVLRHLEQLSNGEVASVLGIDKSAATKRYIRALGRLGEMMPDD